MATVSLEHSRQRHSLVGAMGRLARQGFGAAALLCGGGMQLTLWLIPLGLPLTLLGLALVWGREKGDW